MEKDMSTWNQWSPKTYLKDFYSKVDDDEIETISFLTQLAKQIPKNQKIVEFGTGPTLHHIFPFAAVASEIHMVDYLKTNLNEISKWVDEKHDCHNWDSFIRYVLKCEGNKSPTSIDVEERKAVTSKKITKLMQADARKIDPFGRRARESYRVVLSCYCADSATDNHEDFTLFMKNITSLVKPGGMFITACLRKSKYYTVGDRRFPSSDVDENLLETILSVDFLMDSLRIEVRDIPSHKDQGYTSIILAYATKHQIQ